MDATKAPTKTISMAEWETAYATYQWIEVVKGEVVEMHPPIWSHSHIGKRLYDHVADYLREHPLGEVFADNFVYLLDGSERDNWVRDSRVPDVSFISQTRWDEHERNYPNYKYWHGAPDIAVEIISEHDKFIEVARKVEDYLHYGVRLIWLIDPQRQAVTVFSPDNPDGHTLRDTEILTGDPVLPGWTFGLPEIFGK